MKVWLQKILFTKASAYGSIQVALKMFNSVVFVASTVHHFFWFRHGYMRAHLIDDLKELIILMFGLWFQFQWWIPGEWSKPQVWVNTSRLLRRQLCQEAAGHTYYWGWRRWWREECQLCVSSYHWLLCSVIRSWF